MPIGGGGGGGGIRTSTPRYKPSAVAIDLNSSKLSARKGLTLSRWLGNGAFYSQV